MLILFRNKIFMEGDSGGSSGGSSGSGEGSSSSSTGGTSSGTSSGGTSSGTGFSVTTPDGSVTSTYGSNGTVTTTNNNTGVTTTYTPNGSGGYSVSTNNGTNTSSNTSNGTSSGGSSGGTPSGSSSSGGSSSGSSGGSSSGGTSSGGTSSGGGNSNAPASVSESNGVSVAMANAAEASQAQVAAVSQFAAQAQAVGVAQEAAGVTAEAQAKADAQAAKDAKAAQEANAKVAQAVEAHQQAVAESESADASFASVIGKHYGISVEGVTHGVDGSVTAYGKDGSVTVDANGNVSVKGAASEDNNYASIVAGRYGKESQNAHEANLAAREGLVTATANAYAAGKQAKESAAKANEAKDANAKAQQALADAQASAANAGKAMADAEAAAAQANESVEGAKGTKEEALQEAVNDKAAQDVANAMGGGDGGIGVSDAGDAGNAVSVADEADAILRKGSLQDFAVQFVTADIFAGPARESCIAALQDFITHDPNSVATVTSVLRGLVDSLKSVFSDSSLSIMGKLTQGLKELGSYYQAVKGVLVESKYGKAITALGAFVRVGIGVLAIMAFPQAMLPAIGMWFAKWAFHGLKAYGRDHPGYEPEGNYAMSTWSDSESNALDKELPDLVGIGDEDFGNELKPTKYTASQTPSYAGYNNGLKDTAYSDKTVKEYITNLSRKSPVIKIVMKRIK